MINKIKIALHGKLGSGKSTFVSVAQGLYEEKYIVDAKIAQPIYRCMLAIQKELGLEYTKDGGLMQMLGTHFKNTHGKRFWVDKFFEDPKPYNHIITDIRYPEEFEECKEQGYTMVKIIRDDGFRLEHLAGRNPHHLSETAMDSIRDINYDYLVNNNGSLELLEGAVHHIVRNVLEGRK